MNSEITKLSKLSRQIRIIGLCFSDNAAKKYDSFDLADMLNVEHITIQRDIRALRLLGIPIVQSKKTGITIFGSHKHEFMKHLLLKFIGDLYATTIFDIAFNNILNSLL